MIDVLIQVKTSGDTFGPFKSWADVIDAIHKLRVARAGEISIFRKSIVCDFCSAPKPVWDYEAEDSLVVAVMSDNPELHMTRGDWVACNPCHDLIEAGDWDGLIQRSLEGLKENYGSDTGIPHAVLFESVSAMHHTFRRSRIETPPTKIPSNEQLLAADPAKAVTEAELAPEADLA